MYEYFLASDLPKILEYVAVFQVETCCAIPDKVIKCWLRDHWFRRHQEQETFDGKDGDDVANLLPESLDLGITVDFSNPDEDAFHAAFDIIEQEPMYAAFDIIEQEPMYPYGENDVEALMRTLCLKTPRNGNMKVVLEPTKCMKSQCSM